MSTANLDGLRTRSHLFMVRLWLEEVDEGKAEWRGKLECIASGQVQYFGDWEALTARIRAMLAAIPVDESRTSPVNKYPNEGNGIP